MCVRVCDLTPFFLCRLNGGELFDYVIAKEYLDENEASYYLKQILGALNFCHKKKIVHLDLKVSTQLSSAGL